MTKNEQTNNELVEAIKANTFSMALIEYNKAYADMLQHCPVDNREYFEEYAVKRLINIQFMPLILSVAHLSYLYVSDQIPGYTKSEVERIVKQTMEEKTFYDIIMNKYKYMPDLDIVKVWDKIRNKK